MDDTQEADRISSEAPHFQGGDVDAVSSELIRLVAAAGIGGRLPSERVLAEQLDVSRTLLRDRLGLLEALGIIRRVSGAGTHVQPLDPRRLGIALDVGLLLTDHTTESLQSVRIALERQAASEAASRVDRMSAARMQMALDAIRDNRSSAEVEQADFDFHSALVRASGNSSLIFFTDALHVPLRRSFAVRRPLVEKIPANDRFLFDIHVPILDAVVAKDPHAAMAAVDAHFSAFDAAVNRVRSNLA